MKKLLILTSLTCSTIMSAFSQSYTISTFAGNGVMASTGDGGQATAASINQPWQVAIDASGNIYTTDAGNYIRKINTGGIINTIAGNGTSGYNADGIAATNSELFQPTGVAVDASGNVYIGDQGNQRIRMVNTSGIISTIAGNGTASYSGDGGPATAATVWYPYDVELDASGNLYIADTYSSRIRVINTSGIIHSIAGNGSYSYSGDGGPATAAGFWELMQVAFDKSGNIYIADGIDNRIRIVNSGGIVNTFAGNGTAGYKGDGGPATAAELDYAYGVAVDGAGNIIIGDWGNNAIRMVNTSGIITTIAGNGTSGYSGDGGPATAAELSHPSGILVTASGVIYVADENNNRIRVLTPMALGVNQPQVAVSRINIYPNPNQGAFTVSLENVNTKAQIDIYNVLGEKVCTSVLNANTTQVNMNTPARGIYLYRVVTESGALISNGKFIIE